MTHNVIGRGRWGRRFGDADHLTRYVTDDGGYEGDPGDDFAYGADEARHGPGRALGDLGTMTVITIIEDQVVDTKVVPVEGSEFEWEARRLGRPRVRVMPEPPLHEKHLLWLERLVGGPEALDALDGAPLEADPFGDARSDPLPAGAPGVPADRMRALLERLDSLAPSVLGAEGAIAAHRIALRAVAAWPALVRAPEKDAAVVGAVLLATGRGNDLVGQGRLVLAKELAGACGLTASPSERARAVAAAVSGETLDWPYARPSGTRDVLVLGSADLLVSSFRGQLIRARDAAYRLRAATRAVG